MKPPCEITVNKILPAIRSILVEDLAERHELSQTEMADKLGVTQPAVSQYLGSARSKEEFKKSVLQSEIYPQIQELSDKIASETVQRPQIIKEFCEFCNSVSREVILKLMSVESIPDSMNRRCDLCLKTKNKE